MLLFDEELLTFSMGNCITMEDTNGKPEAAERKRSRTQEKSNRPWLGPGPHELELGMAD
mgnify:CR=1 FL=1